MCIIFNDGKGDAILKPMQNLGMTGVNESQKEIIIR
jgi:hypothetical protein